MAMTKCRECGEPITARAYLCPHCGAPSSRQTPTTDFFEYKSPVTVWGLPLVHIAYGKTRYNHAPKVVTGVIAIGGVVAIGAVSVGVCALGAVGLGALFGLGGLATGYLAIGGAAIGVVAIHGHHVGLAGWHSLQRWLRSAK